MSTGAPSGRWRGVVALLANDRARRLYARAILGCADGDVEDLPPKDRRLVEGLVGVGLLVRGPDGRLHDSAEALRALLADQPAEAVTGVDRYLRSGRLLEYPRRAADRAALLEHIARHALGRGETVSERVVNDRLRSITDDHATLRRLLIDTGVVLRDDAGSSYRLADQRPD